MPGKRPWKIAAGAAAVALLAVVGAFGNLAESLAESSSKVFAASRCW